MPYLAWAIGVLVCVAAAGTYLMVRGYECSAVFLWFMAAGMSVGATEREKK